MHQVKSYNYKVTDGNIYDEDPERDGIMGKLNVKGTPTGGEVRPIINRGPFRLAFRALYEQRHALSSHDHHGLHTLLGLYQAAQ